MPAPNEPEETGEVLDWKDTQRGKVVAVAREEIGPQQRDSDQVREYIRTVMPDLTGAQVRQMSKSAKFHWCGVFALFCLRTARVTNLCWELGRGFVYRLKQTKEPLPGDVFVGPGPAWHHGIVESCYDVDGKPWLASIEGNTPDVRRRDRPAPQSFVYYSIDSLLNEKLNDD